MKPKTLFSIVSILVILFANSSGQVIQWTRDQPGSWNFSQVENWDLNRVPQQGDFIIISTRNTNTGETNIVIDMEISSLLGFNIGQADGLGIVNIHVIKNFSSASVTIVGNANLILQGVMTCPTFKLSLPTSKGGKLVVKEGSELESSLFIQDQNYLIIEGPTILKKKINIISEGKCEIRAPLTFQSSENSVAEITGSGCLLIAADSIGTGRIVFSGPITIMGSVKIQVEFAILFTFASFVKVLEGSIIYFTSNTRIDSSMSLFANSKTYFRGQSTELIVKSKDWVWESLASFEGDTKIQGDHPISMIGNAVSTSVTGSLRFQSSPGIIGRSATIQLLPRSMMTFAFPNEGKTKIEPSIMAIQTTIQLENHTVTAIFDSQVSLTGGSVLVGSGATLIFFDTLTCNHDVNFVIQGVFRFESRIGLSSCRCHQCFVPVCNGKSSNDVDVCNKKGSCIVSERCLCPKQYAHPNATCCFDNGKCNCQNGYFGSNCETTQCFERYSNESSVCSSHGECVDPNTCKCGDGWTGDKCDVPVCYGVSRVSGSQPCFGRGSCESANNCTCFDGYGGLQCETHFCYGMSHTDSNVCNKRVGTCKSPNNCVCSDPSQWSGPLCDIPICNSNISKNCNDQGTCIAPNVCKCISGYTGKSCECVYFFFGSKCGNQFLFPFILFWICFFVYVLVIIIGYIGDFRIMVTNITRRYQLVRKLYPGQKFGKIDQQGLSVPLLDSKPETISVQETVN